MRPIFISYSSKHRDLTRQLASVIEVQYGPGSVWWDHDLESRASYSEQIRTALEGARVVVVIWTAGAMVSDYVYAEAVTAQAQGKLVNVRPADMSFRDIPEPFNIYHIDNLANHDRILSTIAKVMAGTPIASRVPLHEIYFRQHGYRLIDPKQSELARDPREISPAQLLQARFGVVGYLDVTGIKTGLIEWCVGDSRITAGRLVHGPGGLGKTRLMIEVAAALRELRWTAGFLDRPHEQLDATVRQWWQALDQLLAHGEDQGLLIVMDYAEARQDEVKRLAERLRTRSDGETRPIRLVLLARSGGIWWTTLFEDTPEVQIVFRDTGRDPAVIDLPAISTGPHRLDLFRASLRGLAPPLMAQGYVLPEGEPSPERLRRIEVGTGYSRPLAIQIEALLWLASAAQEPSVTGVDGLLRQVLGLERNHWKKLVSSLDDERTRDLARGVAQVTVVQGVPSSDSTERLLMADDFYKGQRTARVAVDPVVRALSRLYGKSDGGIGQLEPDLIGEHHVAMVGDTDLIDGCLRWIEAEAAEKRNERRRDLVTVLQRASQPEHGASANARVVALLDHLISRHMQTLASGVVGVIVDTPGALAQRLDQKIDTLEDESLGAVDAALPIRSLSLMDLSLRVAIRRVDLTRQRLADPRLGAAEQPESTLSHLAACVATLGIRFSSLGRREEALAASQEAVEIRRHLVQICSNAFLPDLAASLNNLGGDLFNLGRREEALAASQEAVDIYRRLVQTRSDAFLPDLATSLSNLGTRLSSLGRRDQALAASQAAVDIYRRLVQTSSDAFLPDLATGLNNHGNRLSSLGRHEEALAASQEAVDIRRHLAQTRPDAFLPDLASSLNNEGAMLSKLGRRDDALAASQEAVDIRRRLTQTRPRAFLPDLAMSLNNLGEDLSNLGRREEALAASQEAVDIRRRLAQTRPDAFLPDLAMSLNNLGIRLLNLGRHEEALAASQEAVDFYRSVAQTRPDAFLPDLATSISNLGIFLSSLGRREEALAASQEAIDIRRRLAQSRPDAFLPDLASSLSNLGSDLSDLSRREEALAACQEVVDIRRRLAQTRREVHLPGLAGSLNNLGIVLSNLGRFEEALAACQEAVDIRRQLAQTHPDAFLPDLANSLSVTSDILASLERRIEAAQAARHALELLAPFVERYPAAHGGLARTIGAKVMRYSKAAAQAPNMELVERVRRALAGREQGSRDPAP